MRLNISENIKRLRKEKGVTQEDLAEAFNVSCQSISRWETDASYPDIELLPIIANYFDVTTDELLGTDKISLEYKRNEYKKQIETLLNDGEAEKALHLCKKAEKEFPTDIEFKWRLIKLYYNTKGIEYAQGKIDEMRKLAQFVVDNDKLNKYAPLCVQIMLIIENEENLEKWTKYTGKDFDFTLPSLMATRYYRKKEFDKYNSQIQQNLISIFESCFLRYFGKINADGTRNYQSRIEGQKTIIAIIDLTRDTTTEKDAWLKTRAFAYFRLAGALFGLENKEKGYEMLNKSLDLYEMLFSMSDCEELKYNTPVLDLLTWTKKEDFCEENEKNELNIWINEWECFAPYKREQQFCDCIERIKTITGKA